MIRLLNCDQVFDVLTRGAVDGGEWGGGAVDHHLRSCHECRSLAEAMRPAVKQFHEVINGSAAMDLPAYRGRLPSGRPRDLQSAVLAAIASEPAGPHEATRTARLAGAPLRVAAAVLLCLAFSTAGLLALRARSPGGGRTVVVRHQPDSAGRLRLASYGLPHNCLPELASAGGGSDRAKAAVTYDCCTRCHSAASARPQRTEQFSLLQRACDACHPAPT